MFCMLVLVRMCVVQNINMLQKELDGLRKEHQHKDCLW